MSENQSNPPPVLKCEDIQDVLLDYMSRELGENRSSLVREHLVRCATCREEAAAIESTLRLLHPERGVQPEPHLSDARRRRVLWSVAHPILDWIYEHHVEVSIGVAVIVVVATALLFKSGITAPYTPPDAGPEVMIGAGPTLTNSP